MAGSRDGEDHVPGRLHQQVRGRHGRHAPGRARPSSPWTRTSTPGSSPGRSPKTSSPEDGAGHLAAPVEPYGRADRVRLRRLSGRHSRSDDRPGPERRKAGQQQGRPRRRPPGEHMALFGGGFTVAQLLMEEAAGKPFPALLSELVLGPLGMADSTLRAAASGPARAARPRRRTTRKASPFRAAYTPIPRWPPPGCGRRRPTWPASSSRSARRRAANPPVLTQRQGPADDDGREGRLRAGALRPRLRTGRALRARRLQRGLQVPDDRVPRARPGGRDHDQRGAGRGAGG
ncbi:MAG: beta-lactamase family protein [Marinilabiliales bacterium]|nr:beta-lactamase family protein [Marinilabiliales bacterium]